MLYDKEIVNIIEKRGTLIYCKFTSRVGSVECEWRTSIKKIYANLKQGDATDIFLIIN